MLYLMQHCPVRLEQGPRNWHRDVEPMPWITSHRAKVLGHGLYDTVMGVAPEWDAQLRSARDEVLTRGENDPRPFAKVLFAIRDHENIRRIGEWKNIPLKERGRMPEFDDIETDWSSPSSLEAARIMMCEEYSQYLFDNGLRLNTPDALIATGNDNTSSDEGAGDQRDIDNEKSLSNQHDNSLLLRLSSTTRPNAPTHSKITPAAAVDAENDPKVIALRRQILDNSEIVLEQPAVLGWNEQYPQYESVAAGYDREMATLAAARLMIPPGGILGRYPIRENIGAQLSHSQLKTRKFKNRDWMLWRGWCSKVRISLSILILTCRSLCMTFPC